VKQIHGIVLKLANTCNINCTYCYWFRDLSVYKKSKVINDLVLSAFCQKLRSYLIKTGLPGFSIVFHGGEPLLIAKSRFEQILFNLRQIEIELNVKLLKTIQSNGILLDDEWIDILTSYGVLIGISIDGPRNINDLNRIDFKGRSTYERTIHGIQLLQSRRVDVGLLAVFNPAFTAQSICDFFIEELKVTNFDVLIPNVNYDHAEIPYIQTFYQQLFELWYTRYRQRGIRIKIARNILNAIRGRRVDMQSIGYHPEGSVMLKPDGELEVSDSLHAIGTGFTAGKLNLLESDLDDIVNDDLFNEIFDNSITLHASCRVCEFKMQCGGGHICNRWSKERRFDNPSVYCEQLKAIFSFATQLVSKTDKSLAKSIT
jgi:uncharacterized protein